MNRSMCQIVQTKQYYGKECKFRVETNKDLTDITMYFNDNVAITVNQEFFTNNLGASEELRRVLGIVRDDVEFTSKDAPAESE